MSFFQAIQASKMCFRIFYNAKTPFQPIKKRSSNSRKIEIFPKSLTHGFGQKMAIIPSLFFSQYKPGKCVLRYSRTKKTPFYPIKTRCSKSRKIEIFPKGLTHGFGQKMGVFPRLFLGNIGQENVFQNILQRKNAFLAHNKKEVQKVEKLRFFQRG